MDKKLAEIRSDLLNTALLTFMICGFSVIGFSLLSMTKSGWSLAVVGQIVVIVIFSLLYGLRARLPFGIRFWVFVVTLSLFTIFSAFQWGLAGGWPFVLPIIPLFFTLFSGRRYGIAATLTTTGWIVLVGYGIVVAGWSLPTSDPLGYISSYSSWLFAALTFLIISLVMVFPVGAMQNQLIKNLAEQQGQSLMLEHRQEELSQILELLPVAVSVADLSGNTVQINQLFRRTFGYTLEDIPTRSDWLRYASPDPTYREWASAAWDADVAASIANHQMLPVRTYRTMAKDGRELDVEVTGKVIGEQIVIIFTDVTTKVRSEAEFHQAVEALAQERRLLRAVIDHLPDAVYAKDLQGRKTLMNYADLANIGADSFEEVLGKTDYELFPPEIAAHFDADDQYVFTTGQPVLDREEHLVNDRGRNVRLLSSKLPLHDSDGHLIGLVGIARDVTAQKAAEEALKRSEGMLRNIFQVAPTGIGMVVDRVLLQVNERICEMTGYSRGELIGQNARLLYPTDDEYDYVGRVKYAQIREHGAGTVETHWQHKDGHIMDILLSSTPIDPQDWSAGVTFTALDITERKRAEAEQAHLLAQIRESEQRIRQIMDTVPEGVLLLDSELRVVLCNPLAREYLAWLGEDVDACTTKGLLSMGGYAVRELLTSPPRGMWHDVAVQGRYFQVAVRALESGPIMKGWVLVLHDVTEAREVEQRTQRQERLAAVGQLAAGIAHDFNNILATITLYSQMSLRAPEISPKLAERLEIIAEQGRRASELINQILGFSRSSALDRQPLDLSPFLKEQVKLWERTLPENIHIHYCSGADVYTVTADPTRIQQVLMNLVLNARDAMPEGGDLEIALERIQFLARKDAPLPDLSPGAWVRLSIADTGTGIAPEVLAHLGDPFFTTKAPGKGTGLGLAQVFSIVASHDGVVDVQTEVGKGTTFVIYLPVFVGIEVTSDIVASQELPLGHGEVILVVEDSLVTREALVNTLEMLNYHVLAADNGVRALEIFDQERETIRIVLSDWVMPDMGGKVLLSTLRQRGLAVPVIVLSGHPLEYEPEALQQVEVAIWLKKPVGLEELAETLQRVLA
ncbi:MAG: PAS domain S-box protein [Anaerolineae bacterium]|nr:PAS domain S-box protein [Anaerolineae bacterium]